MAAQKFAGAGMMTRRPLNGGRCACEASLERQKDCAAYCYQGGNGTQKVEAKAGARKFACWLGQFPFHMLINMYLKCARFSFSKAKPQHSHSNSADQDVVLRCSGQQCPHHNYQSDKTHSRIPFFRDKVRNVIQRLASNSFHPVFLSHVTRVVEGGELVIRRLHLIHCNFRMSRAALYCDASNPSLTSGAWLSCAPVFSGVIE